VLVTALFAGFLLKELFPEYKIYQDAYVELENFRAEYSHQPPPDFALGIKQIVMEKADKGNPNIDRCISCHVALQFTHFSPTKIAKDINGNTIYNADGTPLLVPNEEYVWGHLDAAIAELTDSKKNEQLNATGESAQVTQRLKQAETYLKLKTTTVGEHTYDMTKVLAMHPLIGKETRPFEFHSLDDYGCTSCHSGNGRGLTTVSAHGPVFDGTYEEQYLGPEPDFLEKDPQNDPKFAYVFNHKPGHDLLYQTTPLFPGGLIEAKCVQCHQPSSQALQALTNTAGSLAQNRSKIAKSIQKALSNEEQETLSLLTLLNSLEKKGLDTTLKDLQLSVQDYSQSPEQQQFKTAQLSSLKHIVDANPSSGLESTTLFLQNRLIQILGNEKLIVSLNKAIAKNQTLEEFIAATRSNSDAKGSLYQKWDAVQYEKDLVKHAGLADLSFRQTVQNTETAEALSSDIDALLNTYNKGYSLYLTQACYACHRIAGMARGGVGPELTYAGSSYPWFVKESIVWPQADLKTSTMPNFHLDHNELEALVTFLLGQNGRNKTVSDAAYKIAIQQWEAGKKLDWEKPVSPEKIQDVRYGMKVFATEGCSACHRLEGFDSNVGYAVQKDEKVPFEKVYAEQKWFRSLFPEVITGKKLIEVVEAYSAEIDKHIVDNVRKNGIIEEIEASSPGTIEALYPSFIFASRAKNNEYLDKGTDSEKELHAWKDRIHRVLMVYIQEYGLGRLIGPRPNWSGVYRSDTWLMEHFRNPSSLVAKSIMPVFPFDDTKFYTLTYMLDALGRKNRDAVHAIWNATGFNPELAYDLHCSQCHGTYRQGNGPVAEWIYPIPKNLRNPEFMRNLTPKRAKESIRLGILGTPMPSWGETPKDKLGYDGIPVLNEQQISLLVDWMFNQLPGGTVIQNEQDTPKWEYSPQDVIKELKDEGGQKKIEPKQSQLSAKQPIDTRYLFAALTPSAGKVQEDNSIAQYFDTLPNDPHKADAESYYIKKKFYTPQNLEEGKRFYEIHCAICHGRDADGSGIRAAIMTEAKPRMLNNLNWLHTRDDLRLLRSIKYGVPGTAMTPWGDQTTSLLRMQLVMYIRTLSEQADHRSELLSALYHTYDRSIQTVTLARKDSSEKLSQTEKTYYKLLTARREANQSVAEGKLSPEQAAEIYKTELQALSQLNSLRNVDKTYEDIRLSLLKQKDMMLNLGSKIINNLQTIPLLETYIKAIHLGSDNFTLTKNGLVVELGDDAEKREQYKNEIIAFIDQKISGFLKKAEELEKLPEEPETQKNLHALKADQDNLLKIKYRVISDFAELNRMDIQQVQLYQSLFNKKAP
jgi:mono/diheme cytochrome c family protein